MSTCVAVGSGSHPVPELAASLSIGVRAVTVRTATVATSFLLFTNGDTQECHRPFADVDRDGDVDQTDFGHLQRCISPLGMGIDPSCSCFDRDADGEIGAHDIEAFIVCQSGPSIPVDVDCDRWPLASDDFNTFNLNPQRWTIVDPLGDGGFSIAGTNTGDAHLVIEVPARASHAIWTDGVTAPHIIQATADTDFEIQTRMCSVATRKYQRQGLLVRQDADLHLVFEIYSNGTNSYYLAAALDDGVAHEFCHQLLAGSPPGYLRVTRQSNSWVGSYSTNGTTWTDAAQFSYAMHVAQVGLFAGNEEKNSAPAFAASFDYFLNTAAPFVADDAGLVQDTTAPNVFNVESTPQSDAVLLRWSTDELTTAQVAYGTDAQPELGSMGPTPFAREHFQRIGGLASGTQHRFRLVATDQAGNVAQVPDLFATPETDTGGPTIDVWYGDVQEYSTRGKPQPAVNVLGNVSDAHGVSWLGYSLNNGPMTVLDRGPNMMRLAGTGDFNADLLDADLPSGANQLLIRAVDGLGNVRLKLVTVHNANQGPWPLPYAIDWTQAAGISSVAQVIDGLWVLEADCVRPSVMAYDRLIGIGDVSWQDYEVTVPITVHAVDSGGYGPPSNGPAVGILCRWPGHSADGGQPLQGIYPLGAIGLYRWAATGNAFQIYGNNGFILAQAPPADTLQLGVPYMFKMRVQTEGSLMVYRFKTWPVGEPEPAVWKLSGWQLPVNDPKSGSAVLLAHHVDASFGNVTIQPILP